MTRAFAWQSNRITPGAHTLSQPAGPLDGLILGTGFWAQFPAQIWDRVPCTSQWGARHTVQIRGCFLGPKSGPQIQGSQRGGATAFLVPREPKFTKLPHSNPILISACGDCTLTADHTIRNVKRHLVPHDQTHTHQHLNKPKAKAAGGKPKAGCTRPEEASGRHNAETERSKKKLLRAVAPSHLSTCKQQDPPQEITTVQPAAKKTSQRQSEEAGQGKKQPPSSDTDIKRQPSSSGQRGAGCKQPRPLPRVEESALPPHSPAAVFCSPN